MFYDKEKATLPKAALGEMMGNYLRENNVRGKDRTDVNSIIRDMMSIIMGGALEQEMDEEFGYSKHDYCNKEIDIPRDWNGEFEPQIVKKYQNTTRDMKEKSTSIYAKGMTIGRNIRNCFYGGYPLSYA